MSEELTAGCARPSGGPVKEELSQEPQEIHTKKKEVAPMIKVGKPAPDFTAPGYRQGKFITETLSDHLGKWTLVCFYPGDFTFV